MTIKSHVLKHETSGKFIEFDSEMGLWSVDFEHASPMDKGILEDMLEYDTIYLDDTEVSTSDISIYEVEIKLGNKVK